MEHLDVQLAHLLIHGQLGPAEQARWQAHIEGCARCGELLAAERALLAMLSLGDTTAVPASPDIRHVLDQVTDLGRSAPGAARRKVIAVLGSFLLVIVLASVLAWQLRGAIKSWSEPVRESGVTHEEEEQVIAQLNGLVALEQDPWLANEYETVRTLERLIIDGEP